MQEMNMAEVEQVNGGLIPLLVVLGFVWGQADNIQSVFKGFSDSMSEN